MNLEQKVVFCVSEDRGTVILGVPEQAWLYMRDGHTHTFNLQPFGVPVEILLYGGKDRAAVLQPLHMTAHTVEVGESPASWHIPPPAVKEELEKYRAALLAIEKFLIRLNEHTNQARLVSIRRIVAEATGLHREEWT